MWVGVTETGSRAIGVSTKLWQEALGLGGGGKGRLLPPRPCLRPAHRRRSVFTPLDYKDPRFCVRKQVVLSSRDTRVPV